MKTITKEIILDSQSTDGITDQVEVDFDIIAENEDDSYYEINNIWNVTKGKELQLNSLSDEEQNKITKVCDDAAYDMGYEVYLDSQIAKAEDLYDAWKEGD